MEIISEKNKKISERKNYDILQSLLSYSLKKNIDVKNLTIEEYLNELHKIIFNSAGIHSEEEYVNKLESLIFSLIENSEKLISNINFYKYFSFFIQAFFNLLIQTLKEKTNTNISQFSIKVLNLLNSKDIEKKSGLDNKQIEEFINIERFNKAYNSSKFKIINKFGYYILLFFPEFVKAKDEKIHMSVVKFLKEKQIKKFFKIYEGNETEEEGDKSDEKDI